MVPTSWLTLLLFLLLVSPGLLFDMLGARRRVGAQESAFREIGRIVLGSVGFTAFALLILALAGVVDARLLPDPHGFIQGGAAYFADHFGLVVAAVTAEAVLAHSAAYLLHKYLARRAGGETIRPVSAWSQVFKVDLRGQPTVVHVRVRLTGGIVYSGTVAHYTPSIELADRELVLAPPLYVKVGDKPRTQLPLEYRRVVIRGALIETMAVEYRPLSPTRSVAVSSRSAVAD